MRPSRPNSSKSILTSGEIAVALFTATYMMFSLIFSIALQNREFIFYLTVMGVLIGMVVLVRKRTGMTIGALWGLAIWGFLHMAGGLVPIPGALPIKGDSHVLYNLWLIPGWLKYDQLVHAIGFGVVTWICWQAIVKAFEGNGVTIKPTTGWMVLCVAVGMGFGAANEVVEFIATLTLPNTNVGGYENTGWDLVANLVGGVLAAILIMTFREDDSGCDRYKE